MESKLLPCPFCIAGETIIYENKGVWGGMSDSREPISVEVQHWCEAFEGMTSRRLSFVGRDKEAAIKRWNTRAPDPTVKALVDALENAPKIMHFNISGDFGERIVIDGQDRFSKACEVLHYIDHIRTALSLVKEK